MGNYIPSQQCKFSVVCANIDKVRGGIKLPSVSEIRSSCWQCQYCGSRFFVNLQFQLSHYLPVRYLSDVASKVRPSFQVDGNDVDNVAVDQVCS
ncbi:hypothetical protein ACHQM5_028840 [Ranunculus cassubicifolius]